MEPNFLRSGFHEECAVFGIWGEPDASHIAYLGLYAQQHRGQESAGIATFEQQKIHVYKGLGLVPEVFNESRLSELVGDCDVGHNRHSTAGANRIDNAQPLLAELKTGPLAVAHNGNIVNAPELREKLI